MEAYPEERSREEEAVSPPKVLPNIKLLLTPLTPAGSGSEGRVGELAVILDKGCEPEVLQVTCTYSC